MDRNPLPVTVTVNGAAPALAEAGRIEAMTGAGFAVTANDNPSETPPPGAGFTTVAVAAPVAVKSPAGITAVTWALLTNVVGRADPFHWTIEAGINPLPLKVSVNAAELIAAEAGWIAANTGAGFAEIANVALAEAPPPGAGFTTVIAAVAAAATSAAVIAAVNCVALTKVVTRLAPFH